MDATDSLRAGLAALAAAEEASPSRVWAPVDHECVACTRLSQDTEPLDEAVPGTDF